MPSHSKLSPKHWTPPGPTRTSLELVKDPLRIEIPLVVGVGGALGAVARWQLATSMSSDTGFPVATFSANIVGSLLLGVVLVLGERFHPRHHRAWARVWRPFLGTGVLGGFTTFSTVSLELVQLDIDLAMTYLVASVALGLLAYAIGNGVTRRLTGITA